MKNVIGIDIGAKNIKLVNLALKGKDIELLKLETIEAPKISNQNEIIDLLRIMFRSHKIRLTTPICLSISAEESFFKIISVHSKGKRRLKEAIRDELRKNVVFSLEDCVWDYSLLKQKSKEMLSEVLLVAAKKEAVFEKMQLIKKFNNSVPLINLDILAAYNCLKFNTELLSGKLYALVDMSSVKTQVLIFDEKSNFWVRAIPFGGDKFTNVAAKQLGLSFNEAQEHKKNMLIQESMTDQLKEASSPVMKEIATELDKAFNYYYFQSSESASKEVGHKIDQVFLSGGGSLYFGLDKFLSDTLNIPTRYIYPLNKVTVRDKKILSKKNILNIQLPQFATAFGLALQGLNASEMKVNLIERDQKGPFKNIKVGSLLNFLIVICVALLVFLGTQIVSFNKESKKLSPRLKELKKVTQEYMPQLTDLQTSFEKIDSQTQTLNKIIDNRDTVSRILYKISEIIAEQAWITDFAIKLNYEDRSGELTIGGKSISYAEINQLISGLKDSGYFKEIKPVSSKIMTDKVTREEVVNFIIKLEIRKI